MKVLGKILVYLLAVIVLGALLAPPLFVAGQHVPMLARFDFQKFFNRSVTISALALLWPLIMWLRVPDLGTIGIRRDPRLFQRLLAGFLAAFLVIGLLGILLLSTGVYRLKAEIPWSAFGKITLTAAVVSAVEEFLFRGAILGLMARSLPRLSATIFSSALFAVVHFIKPGETEIGPASVRWWSGFELARDAFWQFSEPMLVLAGFLTLFIVGWICASATLRTGSLWMAIGLHAGWIVGTMGFSKITKRIMKDTLPWFGADLTVGIGSVVFVLITGILVWLWIKYVDSKSPPANA